MTKMRHCHLRSFAFVATLSLVANAFSLSTTRLEVAGQRSLSNSIELVLVYSDPLDASTAQTANFTLTPARTIQGASLDAATSNVIRIELDPSTPLEVGTNYHIQTTSGIDSNSESLDTALTSATFTATSLNREIDNILHTQIPDGAYSTNTIGDPQWNPGEPIRLVPYYGCIAAQGLISAYQLTREPRLLDSVRDYLEWHAAHIPANNFITDYVGYYPTYQSTGSYDSTDSYGALFASTLWKYYQQTHDDAFLQRMYPALEKSVAAMDATRQVDGLTWATPDYKVKFTMDNAEVFQGYCAAAQLARRVGNSTQHDQWIDLANGVRTAIHSNLYLDDFGRYSKGKSAAGNIYTDWETYYPDAMANEFALFYTHQPADAWFQTAWQNEKLKFFPGNVPDPDISAITALVAARASDPLFLDLSFVRALQNHNRNNYSQISAHLIEVEKITQGNRLVIPSHAAPAITVDGQLSEPEWKTASRSIFHKSGVMTGFANESTYELPQNTIDPDGITVVSWFLSGTTLYVGVDADDKFITSADVATDSDGLSNLIIRDASNGSLLHQATYTFYPNAAVNTVPTAPAGNLLANPAAATTAFSFKPGNNTPNDPSDIDTGYQLELAIDLSHPEAGGYATPLANINVGLRIADMDGTPGESWPWSNDAYGTMMQWAAGLTPDQYTTNILHPHAQQQSSVQDWSVY